MADAAPQLKTVNSDSVRRSIKECGVGLLISGGLHFIGLWWSFGALSEVRWARATSGSGLYWIPAICAILFALTAVTMILSGLRMIAIESYNFVRLGSVLALLPLSPAWLISLPTGIWSLVLLSRPSARAAFGTENPEDGRSPQKW
jgi:hypothetical protein